MNRLHAISLAMLAVVACNSAPPEPSPGEAATPALTTSPTTSAATPTIDVRKGRATAFGLQLPRGARLRTSTPGSKTFEVPSPQAQTVSFLRSRLTDLSTTDGAIATTLEGFVSATSKPTRVIVVVRDATLSSVVTVRLEEVADDAAPESADAPLDARDGSRTSQRNPDAIERTGLGAADADVL